jgi:hypothetical protein
MGYVGNPGAIRSPGPRRIARASHPTMSVVRMTDARSIVRANFILPAMDGPRAGLMPAEAAPLRTALRHLQR